MCVCLYLRCDWFSCVVLVGVRLLEWPLGGLWLLAFSLLQFTLICTSQVPHPTLLRVVLPICCCLCLQESGYQDGGSEGFGYSSSSSYAAPRVSHVTASQVRTAAAAAATVAAALQTHHLPTGAAVYWCVL
jgi:hypothetical protein